MAPVLSMLPDFQGVEHNIICSNMKKPYYNKAEVEKGLFLDLTNVEDWSIAAKFPAIKSGVLKYVNCPLLSTTLASTDNLALPDSYYVIQGSTPQNAPQSRGFRDLLPLEWERISRRLAVQGTFGVVLDVSQAERLPELPRLVDRRGLSLAQGIEIMKDPRCIGYIGIDSWLSILAASHFAQHPEVLIVRSKNSQFFDSRYVYMAPHTDYRFTCDKVP